METGGATEHTQDQGWVLLAYLELRMHQYKLNPMCHACHVIPTP